MRIHFAQQLRSVVDPGYQQCDEGTCRHHKGSLLLAVLQQENLEFSTELRDYSQNYTSVVDSVVSTRSTPTKK